TGSTWMNNTTYDVNPSTCESYGGNRTLIGVSPASPSRVYLLSAPRITNGQFCGLYLSTDSGASFTRQSNTPNVFGKNDDGMDDTDQSDYDIGLAVRPNLSSTVFVAGCTVWKSTTSGTAWTHSTSYRENQGFPYIHPDVHCLAYNPLNSFLYAATDGGFYRSTDQGLNWSNFTNALETTQFYHMSGWDGDVNKLMGGAQDNGIKYRDDNNSIFWHLVCCDGFETAFNPITGQPRYCTYNDGAYRFSNAGSHYDNINPSLQYFKTLAVHNADSNIVLIGAGDIFRSLNGGNFWLNKGAAGSWAMTSCPSNNTRFYAAGRSNYEPGSGGRIYFSSTTGDTWSDKTFSTGFPDTSTWTRISDVTVRPANSSYVYASFGGFSDGVKVVVSANTGDSWTNISDNLPNVPVNCLAIDNSNGIYAGTDIGVFYRGATMPHWMLFSNGLPNTPVTDLVIFDNGTTKKIRASTYGRGIWESNLAEACDAAIIVTGNMEGIRHYEASTSITSTSIVQGGIGTFVSFQSGNYITLSEGFNVNQQSEFLGFISPCGQGGIPTEQGDLAINRDDSTSSIILLRRIWNP
ncbi:MAG TPA: hypothetical protein VJ508_07000, partial [Saprospiraceae bacterium]|nr:hypothetical protein [Saprospiraceae bacterium]